ncbi:hypothetical protein WR25_18663 [Diploscapter pachys]|uniref:Uncharacterized protein n=1 Tax=Diploscapter pachys TaxID=2018661 RepID=A0A2A2LK30_9BILA|nr:hypothetical protein WR25_18663 [Diploscapter pachys]
MRLQSDSPRHSKTSSRHRKTYRSIYALNSKAQEYATAIAALTSQLAFYKAKKQIDKQNMNKMGRVKKKEKTKRIPTISIPSISSTSEKVAPSPISSSVHKSASTVSASLNRAHRSPNCFPPATRQQPVSRLEASSSVNSSNVVKNEQKLDTAIPNSEKSSVSLKESSPMTNYSNLMAFRTGSNYTHATFDEEASAEMFRNETRRVQELLARRHSAGSAIGTAGSGIGGTGRDVTDSLNSTQTTTRCDTAVGNLTISKRNSFLTGQTSD